MSATFDIAEAVARAACGSAIAYVHRARDGYEVRMVDKLGESILVRSFDIPALAAEIANRINEAIEA